MSTVVISCYGHENSPYCPGSAFAAARDIARSLSRVHEVVLISSSLPSCHREHADPFRRICLPVGRLPAWAGRPRFDFLLAREARRIRHDLWIESLSPGQAGVIPSVTSQPVVGLLHALRVGETAWTLANPVGYRGRRGLARYERVIALNEADRDLVIRHWPGTNCTVVPHGVHLPDKLPAFGEGRHVLFLGRIEVARKGLDLLLSAISEAQPLLPVLLAGKGRRAEEATLARILKQAHGQVAWVGQVSDPGRQALLRACALMVLPSRQQSFGRSALEAMAWGKPVVCFDLPELRWMGRGAAMSVPAFDVGRLRAAIRQLTADEAKRASMGRAARTVAEQYSWADISERYLDIVRQSLGQDRSPSQGLAS
jgi:phosphatidyl-myo-inositol alpha-mannosyltransferase